jgi:hypothetical protein
MGQPCGKHFAPVAPGLKCSLSQVPFVNKSKELAMKSMIPRYFSLYVLVSIFILGNAYALEYDFEDDEQGWEQINGTVTADKGELIVTGDDGVAVMPDSDWNADWTDYTVQCKMNMEQGTGNMGLVLRYQGSNTYYIFCIVSGRQQVEIWSRIGGNYIDELDINFGNELQTDYIMEVEAKGSDFKVYVDDELITEWSDEKLETGKVGVRTNKSISHFDDVLITGPGIPGSAVEPVSKLATTWGSIKN